MSQQQSWRWVAAFILMAGCTTVGSSGETGLPGAMGPPGPAGPQGPAGAVGPMGERGASGIRGPQGVAGQRGAVGPRGKAGSQGPPGRVGPVGPAGSQGSTGERGEPGQRGADGPAGPMGQQGEKGDTGNVGPVGPQGAQGPQGLQGLQGDPGGFGAYGSFYDTTDVPLALDVATPVPLNTTAFASGISIVDGSKVTFSVAGKFNISFSSQLEKTDQGTDWVSVWLRQNGSDLDWTNTDVAIVGTDANSRHVVAWNFFVDVAMGDNVQLMIASTTSASGRMFIQSVGPQTNPVRPAIPGTILTVNQVGS